MDIELLLTISKYGGALFAGLLGLVGTVLPFRDENGTIMSKITLDTVFLELSAGRKIQIYGDQFTKSEYGYGYPAYSIIFQKDLSLQSVEKKIE